MIKPCHHLRVCLLKDKDKDIYAVEVRAKCIDQFFKSIYWTQIKAILDVIKDSNCIAFIHAERDMPIIHIHKLDFELS